MSIEQKIKQAYIDAGMDRNGYFPAQPCKQCGKPLCGENGPRPAELYAGTFTGFCYPCQNGKEYPVSKAFDGAVKWSFPPHCPAWRRDRETFIGYEGCSVCKGKGRLMVYRANSMGGSYPKNCETCAQRYYQHPVRLHHEKRLSQFRKAIENRFSFLTEKGTQRVEIYRQSLLFRYNKRLSERFEKEKALNLY